MFSSLSRTESAITQNISMVNSKAAVGLHVGKM